jgi:hypothetical protein
VPSITVNEVTVGPRSVNVPNGGAAAAGAGPMIMIITSPTRARAAARILID